MKYVLKCDVFVMPIQRKKVKSLNLVFRITANNFLVAISNKRQKLKILVTAGQLIPTFKGKKKRSKEAVKEIMSKITSKLVFNNYMTLLKVYFYGKRQFRGMIIKYFRKFVKKKKVFIKEISDFTPVPHNGCRLKKVKRV